MTGEGMYDESSTSYMKWSNIFGVLVGAALLVYGLAFIWRNLDLFSF
jgi:hypothetical protein